MFKKLLNYGIIVLNNEVLLWEVEWKGIIGLMGS